MATSTWGLLSSVKRLFVKFIQGNLFGCGMMMSHNSRTFHLQQLIALFHNQSWGLPPGVMRLFNLALLQGCWSVHTQLLSTQLVQSFNHYPRVYYACSRSGLGVENAEVRMIPRGYCCSGNHNRFVGNKMRVETSNDQ